MKTVWYRDCQTQEQKDARKQLIMSKVYIPDGL